MTMDADANTNTNANANASVNPFQPPAPSSADDAPYVYRPLRVLTILVAIALSLDVFFLAASTTSSFFLARHDPGVFAGNDPIDTRSMSLSAVMFLSAVGYAFAYLGGVILFCSWLVRASKNARALGSREMEFTPGWTAGWFFVPVLNLFRPYEAVKELYQASDPDSGPMDWAAFEPPGLILTWWLSWIAFGVVGSAMQNFWNLPFLVLALAAISAVLALRVLVAIDRRQAEKRRRAPVEPSAAVDAVPGNRFL
jgi:hypothetical protein